MTLYNEPPSSRQVQPRPQAVFQQTVYNELGKAQRAADLNQPTGGGVTPIAVGESIPVVFCKRRADGKGGVFISPRAAKFSFIEAGGNITKRYWLVLSSGQLDSPTLTIFYGDIIQGSGTLYYNTACVFTPAKTVTTQNLVDSLPETVGDANGTFTEISCLDFTFTQAVSDQSSDSYSQAHVFTNYGVEVELLTGAGNNASNLFSDLMNYLLQETAQVPSELIDTTGLGDAGTFLENYDLYYDGIISQPQNLRDFLENGSFYFLLFITQENGKWGLIPRLPVTSAGLFNQNELIPATTFTNSDILEGSFEIRYRDASETVPFCAVMSYRNETGIAAPEIKTVEVRYPGEALGGPFERYDLTEFCTSEEHADLIGKYIVALRRWTSHSATLSCSTDKIANVSLGSFVKVQLTLEDSDGGQDSYTEYYLVKAISFSQYGTCNLELEHHPVISPSDLRSRLVDQLTGNFIAPVIPLIGNASITPSNTAPRDGEFVTLTVGTQYDPGDKSYAWTIPAGSSAPTGVDTRILQWIFSFPQDLGEYGVSVSSAIATDTPQTAVVDLILGIGNVTITASRNDYANGETMTLTAAYSGNVEDVTWSWQGPAGTNAPVATETSNVLTWTTGGAEDEGIYTAVASSVTAEDSPQEAQTQLTWYPFVEAVGGTVTYDGDFKIHTFTENGTLFVLRSGGVTYDLEYLICAGGGPTPLFLQDPYAGGGAGGGGVLTGNLIPPLGAQTVQVGIGRQYATNFEAGNSSAFGLTAIAGGHSMIPNLFNPTWQNGNGMNGGCGGGTYPNIPFYTNYQPPGTGSQGGDGATGGYGGSTDLVSGGGGGGASGQNGTQPPNHYTGGNGGEGVTSSISGTSYVYGSGGAGACRGRYVNGSSVVQGVGGTGAGSAGFVRRVDIGGGAWTSEFVLGAPPTNYGAGRSWASAKNPEDAGTQSGLRGYEGMPGIVIIRYQYQNP